MRDTIIQMSVQRQKNDSNWSGVALEAMIIYELHVGTFTPEGTFEAIIPQLKDLRELRVNAIKLMPEAQFPGKCNWGYDGVYPFAAHNSYGGCVGLKQLVNACHQHWADFTKLKSAI